MNTPNPMAICPFKKHKGIPLCVLATVDAHYLEWMARVLTEAISNREMIGYKGKNEDLLMNVNYVLAWFARATIDQGGYDPGDGPEW